MKDETTASVILGVCGEPLSISEISEIVGKAESTVREHVKRLEESGKLKVQDDGRRHLYVTAEGAMPASEAPDMKIDDTPPESESEPEPEPKSETKPKPKTETKVQRGRTKVNLDAKVTFVQGTNPKRSTAAERFALYEVGMSVQEYLNAGGLLRDVPYDVSKGFIKLSD